MTLEKFTDLQQQREKATRRQPFKKPDAALEAETRKQVQTALDRNYNRLKVLFTTDQQFSSFCEHDR